MKLPAKSLLQGGKYRIERELGHGGFGITYLATQTGLNRKVAVKEFFMSDYCERHPETSHVSMGTGGSRETVEKFRKKFVKEAQTIAALDNPHIVSIYDIFEENNTAYYVMKFIDGGSLNDLAKSGKATLAASLNYIHQIADALDYCHKRKILHLDVKPGNILLDEKNNAILIDFGLTKHYDDGGGQTSTTPVGISKGYAPLEQYKRGGVSTFSPETDIYSLGATLYKLVTGATPPEADEVNEDGLPPLPAALPVNVQSAIKAAMQPRRKERPQSIGEFLKILDGGGANADEPTIFPDEPIVAEVIEDFEKTQPNVKQPATTGTINGHQWVDLGLSVKWGTCNIGATSPEEYGDYFAWGETRPKATYTEENCKTYGKNIGGIAGNAAYDAATAHWGGSWRMPTYDEFNELINNCTWQWTTQGGKNGYKVTSKINGNSIFLPAARYRDESSLGIGGSKGLYWSSTPYVSDTRNAYSFDFFSGNRFLNWNNRLYGHSVRPVTK